MPTVVPGRVLLTLNFDLASRVAAAPSREQRLLCRAVRSSPNRLGNSARQNSLNAAWRAFSPSRKWTSCSGRLLLIPARIRGPCRFPSPHQKGRRAMASGPWWLPRSPYPGCESRAKIFQFCFGPPRKGTFAAAAPVAPGEQAPAHRQPNQGSPLVCPARSAITAFMLRLAVSGQSAFRRWIRSRPSLSLVSGRLRPPSIFGLLRPAPVTSMCQ